MGQRNYRAVTAGQSLGDAAIVTFNWTGNTLRPLAPVNLRGSRDSTGGLYIEWTRRSRLGSFINRTDVSLAEESELYEIEVYSGSSLKRSWQVRSNLAQPIVWLPMTTNEAAYTLSANGGTSVNGTGGLLYLRSAQQIYGDCAIEFTINAAALVHDDLRLSAPGGAAGSGVWEWHRTSTSLYPESTGSGYTVVAGDRYYIEFSGGYVRYFLNRTGGTSAPVYVSPKQPGYFPMQVEMVQTSTSVSGVGVASALLQKLTADTIYTAAQQTADFGSTQGSIKVRVYQLSAIVGRGAYVEATL